MYVVTSFHLKRLRGTNPIGCVICTSANKAECDQITQKLCNRVDKGEIKGRTYSTHKYVDGVKQFD